MFFDGVLYCLIQGLEPNIKFFGVVDLCWGRDVSKVCLEFFDKLWPVCRPEVASWFSCLFWCIYVKLCDNQVMVCFNWTIGIICVAFDDGIHELFCAEDIVDSCMVAGAVHFEGGDEHW